MGQINDSKKLKSLDDLVKENRKLFESNPESAIIEIDFLIDKAVEEKNDSLELKLLSNRFFYYYFIDQDFEKMFNLALGLRERAIFHNNQFYEALGHKCLAQTYYFNEFYARSVSELQLALDLLENQDFTNPDVVIEKANIYISFANIYNFKKEYFKALRSLNHAVNEHDKLIDTEQRRKAKFLDYANIAAVYWEIKNLDSAVYYAEKSLSLGKDGEFPTQFFLNYLVLGNVNYQKRDCGAALGFYKKAESIISEKYHLNVEGLYEGIINSLDCLGEGEEKKEYESKRDKLLLSISQKQNDMLRKLINENPEKGDLKIKENLNWLIYLVIAILLIIVIVSLIFMYVKKRKRVLEVKLHPKEFETLSISENKITPAAYRRLLNVLKENDTKLFQLEFQKEFPGFIDKLTDLSPQLNETELELLMMIKLRLSVKEIAQYKFLQPKTIQNRRYSIRKKLNLLTNEELEDYLENINY